LLSDVVLDAGNDGISAKSIDLSIPPVQVDRANPLVIHTRSDENVAEKFVYFTLDKFMYNPLVDDSDLLHAKKNPDFIDIKDKEITIRQGHWNVDRPLIIPKKYQLVIDPGTTLTFKPETYILSKGAISLQGTEKEPIVLQPVEGKTWKGIYVIEAGAISNLSHTEIKGTDFFSVGILHLTGGVNFYKSPVAMSHVRFQNTIAEDQLNIIHSSYDFDDLEFLDSRSDAFDSDFCDGSIKYVKFKNIGGDALDTSGSKVMIENLSASNIGDKALSAGESSQIDLRQIDVNNAGVAVAVKDGSRVHLSAVNFKEIKVHPLMVYTKKPVYGRASLTIDETTLNKKDIVVQHGNSCLLNGEIIKTVDIDVDTIYKSGPMKK
jgi:hypothetical protein